MLDMINPSIPLETRFEQSAETRKLKLEKASREFESLFVYQLLKSMRSSIGSEASPNAGFGKDIFMSIADEALASKIGETGSFGIAETLTRSLERMIDHEGGKAGKRNTADGVGRFIPLADERRVIPIVPDEASVTGKEVVAPDIDRHIARAARRHGVSPALVRAVIRAESGGDAHAVSPKGAKGLMQLLDTTASDMGVQNVFDAEENIEGGTKYLGMLLRRFSGDIRMAVAAYNAGPGAVDRYGGVPPYSETVRYVDRIMDMLGTD
jgi:Rod binding domain-containing protein